MKPLALALLLGIAWIVTACGNVPNPYERECRSEDRAVG
jgi:hypothetical protein